MEAWNEQGISQWGEGWTKALVPVLGEPELQLLRSFLETERKAGVAIEPPPSMVFRALRMTPLEQVRVVILGQDPYPTPGHATGLAFGIENAIEPKARSLLNLFKEIERDLEMPAGTLRRRGSDLTGWASQGVLLLNTVLTVQAGAAGSHQRRGWEVFTDAAIRAVDARSEPVVFLLWGRHAQAKLDLIRNPAHSVLLAAHPSPLSASRGFFGCSHFSKANRTLEAQTPPSKIDWGRTSD
jgi:uracil-DNA glycosylase